MTQGKQLEYAIWTSFRQGLISFHRDWKRKQLPHLRWKRDGAEVAGLRRASALDYAMVSGYYCEDDEVNFVVSSRMLKTVGSENRGIYVAGTFNGWEEAIGKAEWQLQRVERGGHVLALRAVKKADLGSGRKDHFFKFVTGDKEWLVVPNDAPNAVPDETGIRNFKLRTRQTGHHWFRFDAPDALDNLNRRVEIVLEAGDARESVAMQPGEFLHTLRSSLALGADVLQGMRTRFRVFSPLASEAKVEFWAPGGKDRKQVIEMSRADESVWEALYPENLHGYHYCYRVASEYQAPATHFDPDFEILDPYAKAAVAREGPGIVLEEKRVPKVVSPYKPPAWHDLVIAEAHVRDLTANCPLQMPERERLGFTGLRRWVENEAFYLKQLGVNAVELQPVQEFDAESEEEYHWGYMTTNFFAPCSRYALEPEKGSQVEEFAALVDVFHGQGMAVLLDVVYNHVGVPNHLAYLAKHYYFDLDAHGEYMNWSGCGNVLRTDTPMGRRLVIDSLIHLVKTYDVDGFRFDLAELLGKETLVEVERALKAVKPSIILIAEPWSFRGHIAHALKSTGFASWNDGFRDFVGRYIWGKGNMEGLRYYLGGSMAHLSAWPAQSVNYTESHDDYCWIDRITENPRHDGSWPTSADIRRTHLMFSILFMSLGIPMVASGQEMLKSKKGVHNTYLRGDLNALRYDRAVEYSQTHTYVRNLIRLRLGRFGKVLRRPERPSIDYIHFHPVAGRSSLAALFNANGEAGCERILFAINPHGSEVYIPLYGDDFESFRQVGDHNRVDEAGVETAEIRISNDGVFLPGMTCGIWLKA